MTIIFLILFFILFVALLVLSMFGRLISGFFRLFRGGRGQQSEGGRSGGNGYYQHTDSSQTNNQSKVFSQEEGEYVGYEEVE